jgi:hypothetical protein
VVDALLPNSALLLVDGWGHTTLGLSTCAQWYSEQYLIAQAVPPPGTVCPQDVDPFPPAAVASGSSDRVRQLALEARRRFLGGD